MYFRPPSLADGSLLFTGFMTVTQRIDKAESANHPDPMSAADRFAQQVDLTGETHAQFGRVVLELERAVCIHLLSGQC